MDPLLNLTRLGMARAYGVQGDKERSRAAYEDFFAAWKESDPDIVILKSAEAEYEKVK